MAGQVGISRFVIGFFIQFSLRPEQTVGHDMAHAGMKTGFQAMVQVSQCFGGGGLQVAQRLDDVAAFQEIDKRGLTQYIQQVPSTGRSDLMPALKAKGFV